MVQVIIAIAIALIAIFSSLDLNLRSSRDISNLKQKKMSEDYLNSYAGEIQMYIVEAGGVRQIETLPQLQNSNPENGAPGLFLDPDALAPQPMEKSLVVNGKDYQIKSLIELKKYPESQNIADYAVITTDLVEGSGSSTSVKYSITRVISR